MTAPSTLKALPPATVQAADTRLTMDDIELTRKRLDMADKPFIAQQVTQADTEAAVVGTEFHVFPGTTVTAPVQA